MQAVAMGTERAWSVRSSRDCVGEVKRLKLEREIMGKAAAWFAQESAHATKPSSDS